MRSFFNNFGSTEWWLSVVIVGIAVNLLSAVLQSAISHLRSAISKRYQQSKSREAERRRELIASLKSDPTKLSAYRSRLVTRKLGIIEFMLCGVFLLLVAMKVGESEHAIFQIISSLGFIAGNATWLLGMNLGVKAVRDEDVLSEAEK